MTDPMNCTAFDERLAEYLEDEVGLVERQAVQTHLASCVRCASLVRDLERITADAGQLGALTPSRDLWDGIAERIETPVVPLPPRRSPNVDERHRRVDRWRLAAVAAALVAVTAGVTYTLTVSSGTNVGSTIASQRAEAPRDSLTPTAAQPSGSAQPSATAPQAVATNDTPRDRADDMPSAAGAGSQNVGNVAANTSQSREIDRLRAIFARNRGQLDPRTAAIIEANLKVIDDAIAQSRAALEQDPASRFLSNQLNTALDKKIELLRTAAMLPNRT